MRSSRGVCAAGAAILAALVLASGCYPYPYGPYSGVVGGPAPATAGPPGPSMRPQQMLGLGVSAGLLMASDELLLPGLMWDLGVSMRLSDMLAVGLDVSSATMTDDSSLGGDMTVTPMIVSAIFSLPYPTVWGPDVFRWRFGVGAGVAAVSHSVVTLDADSVSLVAMQFGNEWLIQGGGRIFWVMDLLMGDEVLGGGYIWDLTSMGTLRGGIEIGF